MSETERYTYDGNNWVLTQFSSMHDLKKLYPSTKAYTCIYRYQLLVVYSKSSKILLQGILTGRDQCLLQGSTVQDVETKKIRHLWISKNGDYQISFEIDRKLVKVVTGNAIMKRTAEVKLLKKFLQYRSQNQSQYIVCFITKVNKQDNCNMKDHINMQQKLD